MVYGWNENGPLAFQPSALAQQSVLCARHCYQLDVDGDCLVDQVQISGFGGRLDVAVNPQLTVDAARMLLYSLWGGLPAATS
jgi:hypothetical protein